MPKPEIGPIVPDTGGEAIPPEQAREIKFDLVSVQIDGVSVYSRQELLPLYESYLGKEVSLLTIYDIANAITTKYRNDGYILTRTIIPPQKISSGHVQVQVIEGYVDKVIIEGTSRDGRGLIKAYGDKITKSRPLNV
ncbi:MAG: ShlB/FhaC/HecB family hemolysin secretion/activation protein [Nitrosopumilus sp.]|nr:ShlB/FhaC/HecB family hemolysin secretion/activation protein [Nitrosopumilus sp.]